VFPPSRIELAVARYLYPVDQRHVASQWDDDVLEVRQFDGATHKLATVSAVDGDQPAIERGHVSVEAYGIEPRLIAISLNKVPLVCAASRRPQAARQFDRQLCFARHLGDAWTRDRAFNSHPL
jgi:hypothetical protein